MNHVRTTTMKAQNGAAYWLLVLALLILTVLAAPAARADDGATTVQPTKARAMLAAQKAARHFARLNGQSQPQAKLVRVNAIRQSPPKR